MSSNEQAAPPHVVHAGGSGMNNEGQQQQQQQQQQSPEVFLQSLAQRPPSRDALAYLGGTMLSSLIKSVTTQDANEQQQQQQQAISLPALYLYAVAKHLPTAVVTHHHHHTASTAAAADSRGLDAATLQTQHIVEAEIAQQVQTILTTVSYAASVCQPRSHITQAGILPCLWTLVSSSTTTSSSSSSSNNTYSPNNIPLSAPLVEFLQTCVHAEQYQYAERCCCCCCAGTDPTTTWPRPVTLSAADVTVQHVLRYFYLRGIIHMANTSSSSRSNSSNNNNNYQMAIRCFWTCCSIPAEVVSPVQVAAWKKMVLVQCLHRKCTDDMGLDQFSLPLALPKKAPNSLLQLIQNATGRVMLESSSSLAADTSSSGTLQQQQQYVQPDGEFSFEAAAAVDAPEVVMVVEPSSSEQGQSTSEQQQQQQQQQQQHPRRQQQGSVSAAYSLMPYIRLVRAFVAIQRSEFDALLEQHQSILQQDGNLDVAYQCRTALLHRHLYQVSNIYSVIPLPKLAFLLQLPDSNDQMFVLQNLLLYVSMEQVWDIQVDLDNNMVIFPPRPPPTATSQDEIVRLTHMIRNLDVDIACSNKYANVLRKEKNKSASAAAAAAEAVGPRGVEDV